MKNDWNNKIAKEYVRHYSKRKVNKELAERIYTTHLLGKNSDLVLHGGGNTSVKSVSKNFKGKNIDVIYVKGSGWDMSNLSEKGMPGIELEPLKESRKLNKMNDKNMTNFIRKNLLKTICAVR
mgnify:FL=1